MRPTLISSNRARKAYSFSRPAADWILLMLVLLFAGNASAQNCGNNSAKAKIRVCNLAHTFSRTYNLGSTMINPVNFSLEVIQGNQIRLQPYTFEFEGTASPDSSSYTLTNAAGEPVNIQFTYTDSQNATYPLRPDATGTATGSATGRSNLLEAVRLDASISSPLNQLAPGIYSGEFRFTAIRSGKGQSDSQAFTLQLSVAPAIQIARLDPIPITPSAASGNDAQSTEYFCVFTQGQSSFSIRAESQNSGGSGAFVFAPTDDGINYQVEVGDLGAGTLVALGNNQAVTGSWPGNGDPLCSGSDNMQLLIRVPASELAGAKSTTYTDTLILTVELQ
ncbi:MULTISPECIES: hypothetical protein [unclassified Microbulbifer]|uniref:hypothetical protein n=1 Tax=unclassified Microbulbifer TaxID=2619833 RepID=UPI001E2CE699|nr:hypothetical protein [Microbulbifer sp. YPW16]UHQ54767.1 hypothetical protein LVE68_14845 [Microbulbifer sp. YPW16]